MKKLLYRIIIKGSELKIEDLEIGINESKFDKPFFELVNVGSELLLFKTLLYSRDFDKKEEYKKLCLDYHNKTMNSLIDNLKLDLKKLNEENV